MAGWRFCCQVARRVLGSNPAHGRQDTAMIGRKNHHGRTCCALSALKRRMCSFQKKKRQKSGSWL
ncbi:hypothetical protein [Pseudomonas sp. 22 E 5]|nr:hypothetical protein [Pseudomonas sp. 22 E 5]